MAADRDAGFAHADIDTSLLHDPKIIRLSRLNRRDFSPLFVVYVGTVLASWREGRRLSAVEAETWVEATPKRLGALHDAGLLDAEGRIPEHAWKRWFMPAANRREAKSLGGRKGRGKQDEAWHVEGIPEDSSGIPATHGSQTGSPSGSPSVSPSGGGRAGARDGSPSEADEVLERAGRLTGKPELLPHPRSKMYLRVKDLVERHGLAAVLSTFDRIAGEYDKPPTFDQLAFPAFDALDLRRKGIPETEHERTVRELKALTRAKMNGQDAGVGT